MALFKIHKGERFPDSGQITKATEGFAYFTTDDGKFYIDIAGDGTTDAIIRDKEHPLGNRVPLNAAQADYVKNNFILRIANGNTEDNNLYTFNGSASKLLNLQANNGINFISANNSLTIGINASEINTGILSTAYGGTGNNTYLANRLIYSETDTKLNSANNIHTDGNSINFLKDDTSYALITNKYNNVSYALLRDHHNGDISLNASSGNLHLGYANTGGLYLYAGKNSNNIANRSAFIAVGDSNTATTFTNYKIVYGTGGSSSQPVYVDTYGKVQSITGALNNNINGNASTATAFASDATISLTGDITGSANGTHGWSISTTIGTGKVTNAMLAGSITNNKLVNSTIGIAGTNIALGSSIDKATLLSNLGLTNAAHYIGKATEELSDGGTENPTISGYDFANDRKSGDIVLGKDGDKEYIWGLNGWELLGPIDTIQASTGTGTQNRMAYYSAANMISSSSHYTTDTEAAINKTSITDGYSFEVNGDSIYDGNIRLNNTVLERLIAAKVAGGIGWSRNIIELLDKEDILFARFGAYGNADDFKYIFIGTGAYNSANNLRIYAAADNQSEKIAIGRTTIAAPAATLYVKGTPGEFTFRNRKITPVATFDGQTYFTGSINAASLIATNVTNNSTTPSTPEGNGAYYLYGNNVEYAKLYIRRMGLAPTENNGEYNNAGQGAVRLSLGNTKVYENSADGEADNAYGDILLYYSQSKNYTIYEPGVIYHNNDSGLDTFSYWGARSTTADEDAYATWVLGNSVKKTSTTAHSEGRLRIYSDSSGYHQIVGTSTTGARVHYFPDTSGWIVTGGNGTTTGVGGADQIVYLSTSGVLTAGTSATNANTANTIVKRDASGNFSAGTIIATLSGNAATATKVNNTLTITLNNNAKTFDGSADTSISFYAPTAGGTANTQALVGNGATTAPKWVNISPSITITAGTASATPKVNVTVLGQSGTAQAITTATTGVYGATKLTDAYTSTDATLAATGKSILAAIQTLDVTAVGVAAATGNRYISQISETDGKISAVLATATIGTTTTPIWVDAGTIKPGSYELKATVNEGTAKYIAYYESATQIKPTLNAHFNWSNLSGTTKGYEELVLGNKSDRFGRLALYSHSDVSGGSYIVANNPTSWINHVLPDTAGWIVTAGDGSSTGQGGTEQPVYVDATGVVKNTTYHLKAHVEDGSVNHLAYYSAARTIDYIPKITYFTYPSTDTTNGPVSGSSSGLIITETSNGGNAGLKSGNEALVSYGDSGPQIRFASSDTGILLYHHYDTASDGGAGSFHFLNSFGVATAIAGGFTSYANSANKTGFRLRHKTNNVSYGFMRIATIGTASTVGDGELTLGNATAEGTDGNARGSIYLYAANTHWTGILAQGNGNRTFYLPNYAGNGYFIHAASNDAVGSTGQPIYAAANGRIASIDWHIGNQNVGEHNANNIKYNMIGYYTSNGPAKETSYGFQSTNGAIYAQGYSTSWVGQIAQDYCTGGLAVRGLNNGTWTSWLQIPTMTQETYPALLNAKGSNGWIKIGTANTSYGLLPSQTGGAGSGHNYLGTSSWYWKYAYIDEIHGNLKGNADTATKWAAAQKVYVTLGTASTTTTIQGGSTSAQTIGVDGTLGTAHGGTGNTSYTASRLVYTNTATKLSSTTNLWTDGTTIRFLKNGSSSYALLQNTYNSTVYDTLLDYQNGNIVLNAASLGLYLGYSNTTYIDFIHSLGRWTSTGLGVGTTSPSYKLHVAGTGYFTNTVHINKNSGTGLVDVDTAPLLVGTLTSANLAIGNNAIQARSNHTASKLWFNFEGGSTSFGSSTSKTAPTTFFGTVTPGATDTYHLGTASLSWKTLNESFVARRVVFNMGDSPITAGWRRICKINAYEFYLNCMILITGRYSSAKPAGALVSIHSANASNITLNLLSGYAGSHLKKLRLVSISGSQYWLDIYTDAFNNKSDGTHLTYGNILFNFYGNVTVSDIQTSLTTQAATGGYEIDLINTAKIKLGAELANGYWGITTATGANNDYIRTTTLGLIPYQSGGVGDGHSTLGTSGWCFKTAYINDIYSTTVHATTFYGTLSGTATTANNLKTTLMTNASTAIYVLGATGTTADTSASVYKAYRTSTAQVYFRGDTGVLMGAAWNDYAEYRQAKNNVEIEPGRVVKEVGDETLELATSRLQRGCSIVSNTFGISIGESETNKLPLAVAGRVLAYPYENLSDFRECIGWPVCSGPNGTVSIMTEEEERDYPSRIIGTIASVPDYEVWHGGADVEVNGRVWIKVR